MAEHTTRALSHESPVLDLQDIEDQGARAGGFWPSCFSIISVVIDPRG